MSEIRRHGVCTAERSPEDALTHRRRTQKCDVSAGRAFPKFSRLPKELRLRVWEMAAEQPRVVVIHSAKREEGDETPPGFISSSPPPAVLHVCAESRGMALTRYSVLLMSASEPNSSNISPPSEGSAFSTYFNLAQDVLYFRTDLDNRTPDGASCIFKFVDTVHPSVLKQIRSIGIDINTTGNCYACDWMFLAKLPSLEVLCLGLEVPELDLGSILRFTLLQDEDMHAFVEDYRMNFDQVHPELSESSEEAAIEEIKRDSIYWWWDNERTEFEASRKPEIRLVMVENF